MKNKNLYKVNAIAALFLIVVMAVSPAEAEKTSASKTTPQPATAVQLEVKPLLTFERKFKKVEIVVGESEYTLREKAARSASVANTSGRQVVSRERPQEESLDLANLRALYREAAGKYSIDWRLIEAVHQVETGKSQSTCIRSSAGATGPMQFLPSTFRHYSDGGDICSLRDAVFAGANLLAQAGASSGDIDSALFSYNHSRAYVEKVKSVMNSI